MSRVDISDSKSTLNDESEFSTTANQTIEVTADSVLIKKERVRESKHGEIFKGERVSMYSELGIQDVLINEINLSEKPKQGMQFFHERISAPALSYSVNSPHIAKCFGLYMNSKGTQVWLVTEFLSFSVHDLLESGPLDEQQIAFIVAEVIKGLDYLHSLGICHRDVVSRQVMLTPTGEVKLAGFHLAVDTLDSLPIKGETIENEDSSCKDDILSLGKMAIELIQGPQISEEHILAEKDIPSLLNQFSQNFRNVITSCLHKDPNRRPSSAQLVNHQFVKKMKKSSTLKDYKLLFNRCKRFKRSLARRKRNLARRESGYTGVNRQLSKVTTPEYDEVNSVSSTSDLQSPITPQDSVTFIHSATEVFPYDAGPKESDLPLMTWDFGNNTVSSDHLVQLKTSKQRQHSVSEPVIFTFKTVTVITEERIYNSRNSDAEKIFIGTFKDGDHPSFPCLVKEIDLSKLSRGAANKMCNGVVTPLLHHSSSNIVKVLHVFSTESEDSEHDLGSKLYLVTEHFVDSVHDLQMLGPLDEDLIAWILREVLKGLDYLHTQRIAYGNMTTHHILFSVASGSFEVKLDHSHAVVDELDDRTASNGSETSFNRNLKADIWSLGVIAAQLAHCEPPSSDPSQQAEESTPSLPSAYSKQFGEFVASCLQKSRRKRPTAHELLQSSFIKDAKETCGLESVFDLYWKHKVKKEKQLHGELTESNLGESNLDINSQVPPSVNWSFDEPPLGLSDEVQPLELPQPPPLSSWNENETDDTSRSQVLMKRHRQLTQESVYSQNTDKSEFELASQERQSSTPLQQQQQQLHGSSTSLPEHIHSRVKHKRQQGQRRPLPRPESYGQPPPNLQAGPWWMYPPWFLPPPWWLHPPSPQQMASGQYVPPPGPGLGFYPQPPWWHQPPSPQQQMAGSQYGNMNSPRQGLGFCPPPPRFHHPSHAQSMAEGQHTHPQTQGMSPPQWPHSPSWWQYPQQQPLSPDRYQEHHRHAYESSSHEHLTHQHRGEFGQPHHGSEQSQSAWQPMSAHLQQHVDLGQLQQNVDPQIRDFTLPQSRPDDDHVKHEKIQSLDSPSSESTADPQLPRHMDSPIQEISQLLSTTLSSDNHLQPEDMLTQHIPLLQSIIDSDLVLEENSPNEMPQLQPNMDDLVCEHQLAQELPPLQSSIDENLQLCEDEDLLGKDQDPPLPKQNGLTEDISVEQENELEEYTQQLTDENHRESAEDLIAIEQEPTITDHLTKQDNSAAIEESKLILVELDDNTADQESDLELTTADSNLSLNDHKDQVIQTPQPTECDTQSHDVNQEKKDVHLEDQLPPLSTGEALPFVEEQLTPLPTSDVVEALPLKEHLLPPLSTGDLPLEEQIPPLPMGENLEDQLPPLSTGEGLPFVEEQLTPLPTSDVVETLPLEEQLPPLSTGDLPLEEQIPPLPMGENLEDQLPPLLTGYAPLQSEDHMEQKSQTADNFSQRHGELIEQDSCPISQEEAQPFEKVRSVDLPECHSPQPVEEVENREYSLQDLVKQHPLKEHQIATIILKVVKILVDLHSQGKVHNNVTIANITLSESGEVKLMDSHAEESILRMVPEADQLIEDDKADIWSLGITAVEIANGEPPDASTLELLFANSFTTPQFLDDDDFSEEFEDFIGSCLKSDPDERLSAQKLLEHAFFASASQDSSLVVGTLVSQYKDWTSTLIQPTADDLVLNEDQLAQHPNQLTLEECRVEHDQVEQQVDPITSELQETTVTHNVTIMQEEPELPPSQSTGADDHPQKQEDPMINEPQPMVDDQPTVEGDKLDEQPPQPSINELLQGEDQMELYLSPEEKERKFDCYSLEELVKPHRLEEHQIATIILKVVQILDNLHSQGKVHNNVTIANITLSDSGEVELMDSRAEESILRMVPEADQLIEDEKADVWSLGITAVEIANGEPPDASMLELLFANSFITPQFLDDDDFSEEFEDFIGSCLKSDPDERYSTQELLEHDFLTSATADTSVMSSKLITQYKEWKSSQSGGADNGI